MWARRSTSARCSTTPASGFLARSIVDDQAALEALLDRAAQHGTVGLVIDKPGSIAQLAIAVARAHSVPVAMCPAWSGAGPPTSTRVGQVSMERPAPLAARLRRGRPAWRSHILL
jgi:hypothetical protein